MKKLFLGLACAASLAACGNAEEKFDGAQTASIVPVTEETADECRDWNAKLAQCAPYRCVFVGAEGDILGKEINGIQNGKCLYAEQVSADKALQCSLAPQRMQDMARYYQMTEMQEDIELAVMQLADGSVVYQEMIGGRPVKTPLQQALSDRSCHMKNVRVSGGETEWSELQFGQGKEKENIVL